MRLGSLAFGLAAAGLVVSCGGGTEVDLVLRGGTIYDGTGGVPVVGDLAIEGDSVVAIGNLGPLRGRREIDVTGLAVAPGFINMLSWATESLIVDGRGLSDVAQGITLEVFGEGLSMGPLNQAMKEDMVQEQGDIRFAVSWTTLDEYLTHLVSRGISPNVASFVGASTVRIHELGEVDRDPSAEELERMEELVREAMRDGALGVGSSLIYTPGVYAETDELVALASASAEFGGMYTSHLRSEADRLIEAVDELIHIARASGGPAEIYHLKQAGSANWEKLDDVIQRVEVARSEGLAITADMYTYTAGRTGLDASMPPWVQEGGYEAWAERLRDQEIRERVVREMRIPTADWENFLLLAGSADRVLLVGFRADSLKRHTGKTLSAVADEMGMSPESAAVELVLRDGSRVGTVYFLMSEENVRRQVALPWMSFGSDEGAPAPEGPFLQSNPHPRAYGNVARLLRLYIREEGLIPLTEAIRRLTDLPATNLKLRRRGRLSVGFHADIVVFDPAAIADNATFEEPHQLATGVRHVFINGVQVLSDGSHTGATPGRVIRGPGWRGWEDG